MSKGKRARRQAFYAKCRRLRHWASLMNKRELAAKRVELNTALYRLMSDGRLFVKYEKRL